MYNYGFGPDFFRTVQVAVYADVFVSQSKHKTVHVAVGIPADVQNPDVIQKTRLNQQFVFVCGMNTLLAEL